MLSFRLRRVVASSVFLSLAATGVLWLAGTQASADVAPTLVVHKPSGTPYEHSINHGAALPLTKAKSTPRPTKALSQVQGSITVIRSNLGWLDEKIAAQSAEINADQQQLKALKGKIATDNAHLSATREQYHYQHLALAKTKARLSQRMQLFDSEMRYMQEHGEVSYLSVFVDVHSFADFISRVFLLAEVGRILAHQVQIVQHVQHHEQVLQNHLLASLRTMTETSHRLSIQATALQSKDQADSGQQRALVALRAKAVLDLHKSIRESADWKKLTQSQPQFLDTLSSRLGTINQTLEDLLGMGLGGPMSRPSLYQTLYPTVEPIAKTFSLPIPLVMAIITEESGGQQGAISRTGAIGLMQLEPGTARFLGINPYNPKTNVIGGCLYIHQLLQLFNGNLSLALSAYNAGPEYVIQTQAVLPATKTYVTQVQSLYQAYRTMVYTPPAPIPIVAKKPPVPPKSPVPIPPPIIPSWGWVRITPS